MADRTTGLHEEVTLPLITGAQLFSADGQEMGLVKDIREDFFKVDAPLKRDYWLSRDDVLSASPERVTVRFDHADLDTYRLADPSRTADAAFQDDYREDGADQADADILDATGHAPILLDDDEQLDQRQRMEAELAEQRRHLPSNTERN